MEKGEYDKYLNDFYTKFNQHVKDLINTNYMGYFDMIDMIYNEIIANEKGDMNIGNHQINIIINAMNGYIHHLLQDLGIHIVYLMHHKLKVHDNAVKIMNFMLKSLSQNTRIHIFLVAHMIIFNYDLINEYIMRNGRIVYDCNIGGDNTGGINFGYIIDVIAFCTLKFEIQNRVVFLNYFTTDNKIIYCERHSKIRNDYRAKVNSGIKIVLSNNQIKEINEFFNDDNVNNNTFYFFPNKKELYNKRSQLYQSYCGHYNTFMNHKLFDDPIHRRGYHGQCMDGYHDFHDIHDKDDFIIMYPYDPRGKIDNKNKFVSNFIIYSDNKSDFISSFMIHESKVQTTLINVLEDKNIIITESMMIFFARYCDYESFILAIKYGGIITEKVLESACNIDIGYASPIEKYQMINICCKHVKPTKTAFRNIIKSRDSYNFKFKHTDNTEYTVYLESYFPTIDRCFTYDGIITRPTQQKNIYSIMDHIIIQDEHTRQYSKLDAKYRKYHKVTRDRASRPYAYYYALNEAINILIKNGFKIEYDDLLFAYKNDVMISSTFIDGMVINKDDFSKNIYLRDGICTNYYKDLINANVLKVCDNKTDDNIINEKKESKISEEYYKVTDCGIIDDNQKLDGNIITFINDDIKKLLKIKDTYVTYIQFRQMMMRYISLNNFITQNEIKLPDPFTFNNKTSINIVDINNWILSLLNPHNSHDTVKQNKEVTIHGTNSEETYKIRTILDIDDIDDVDEIGKTIKKRQRIVRKK